MIVGYSLSVTFLALKFPACDECRTGGGTGIRKVCDPLACEACLKGDKADKSDIVSTKSADETPN
jgi:hypothetical protein